MKNETKDQEQPKQEQHPKERDWFNRVKIKVSEKGHGQSDVSGSSQAGERWAGRIFGAGRER